jgi:hypothetical protein
VQHARLLPGLGDAGRRRDERQEVLFSVLEDAVSNRAVAVATRRGVGTPGVLCDVPGASDRSELRRSCAFFVVGRSSFSHPPPYLSPQSQGLLATAAPVTDAPMVGANKCL